MQELKENLRENFIKPLKFKFLVEKLESSPQSSPEGKEVSPKTSEKDEMFKQIHDAYKKFNV